MTATTDPARVQREHTTGINRDPAQPTSHNGDGDRGTPCAARSGSSSPSAHALRLLDLARRAEQAQPPLAALIFDAAADLLLEHGWCQGMAADLTGSCLEYALFLAGYRLGASTADIDALIGGIDRRLGMAARDWNDTPGRTVGDVVALLRSCAEEARV